MASSCFDDGFSSDEIFNDWDGENSTDDFINLEKSVVDPPVENQKTLPQSSNVVYNLINRQIYGRFTKHPRAKTERIFNTVHHKCKVGLSSLFAQYNDDMHEHIFMGLTICGQYFLSYTMKSMPSDESMVYYIVHEYDLYIWRFSPHKPLVLVSKHRIFKHMKDIAMLDEVLFLQFPKDPHKLVCYGLNVTNPEVSYISILTIPSPKSCINCFGYLSSNEEAVNQGWCEKHGFIIHYMFTLSQKPLFAPKISLAFPNHIVINTGHHIHVLNTNTVKSVKSVPWSNLVKDTTVASAIEEVKSLYNDSLSENLSDVTSDNLDSISVIDANLEELSCEFDLESSDCNKPFHELNISCEPLNVTGKSYHNAVVQNLVVDGRVKRFGSGGAKEYLFSMPQMPQTSNNAGQKAPKPIDKKTADKTYEFIEETDKCVEKLSSFRKKRLAEKKYEFSEDNSENIIPFNSLRRERRFAYRSQSKSYNSLRSPDLNSLFLSPRSPMQSPNSRSGQFSPGRITRNSPHHHSTTYNVCKSPISPREATRKFSVYSPSVGSDCSDNDSRLIMRLNGSSSGLVDRVSSNGLLIVAPKAQNQDKWISKVVRRYTNGDFETSSLVSGQSRDDFNTPIEIPCIVQNLTEQQFEVVPEFKPCQINEMQLLVTQKSFDCEQFVYKRAQTLCGEALLKFFHYEDYDIQIIYVCPLSGAIVCKAAIKIGALPLWEQHNKPKKFVAQFLFMWNLLTDALDIIESKENKLLPLSEYGAGGDDWKVGDDLFPLPRLQCNNVYVMDCDLDQSKTSLRDIDNYYEIVGLFYDHQEESDLASVDYFTDSSLDLNFY